MFVKLVQYQLTFYIPAIVLSWTLITFGFMISSRVGIVAPSLLVWFEAGAVKLGKKRAW